MTFQLPLGVISRKIKPGDSLTDFLEKTELSKPVLVQLNGRKPGIRFKKSGFQTMHGSQTANNTMRLYRRFEQPVRLVESKPGSVFGGTLVSFGRAGNNDIVIDDKILSRSCATFRCSAGCWYLENRADVGTLVESSDDETFQLGWIPAMDEEISYFAAKELLKGNKVELSDFFRFCFGGPMGYRFEWYSPKGLYRLITDLQGKYSK